MLRSHAGWSLTSKMPQRYLHYFGHESSKSILQIKGVIKENEDIQNTKLKPRYCPNCNESNKHEAKICNSCKMILSYESYKETVESENEMEDALAQLSDQVLILSEKIQKLEKSK